MTAPPKAEVANASRLRPLIWLFPLGAAVAAGFFAYDQLAARGPLITIRFPDASGVRSNDTHVLHRGIVIGQVVGVDLSADKNAAEVTVRLQRDQAAFAAKGASFWLVGPEFTEVGIGGLGTLFSGPYIAGLPGTGKPHFDFTGLPRRPLDDGLRLVLRAPRIKTMLPGAPVSFRGVRVGLVRDLHLTATGDGVDIDLVVWKRYSALVRAHSRFWAVGGVEFKGGLLSGVDVKLDSARDLVTGEISFATPEKDMGPPPADGARFTLEDTPQKEWLGWAPRIRISPASLEPKAEDSRLPTGKDLMGSKLK